MPEGSEAARVALAKFAKLDKSSGLLGRGIVRFDMRDPKHMVVRLPKVPGPAAAPGAAGRLIDQAWPRPPNSR